MTEQSFAPPAASSGSGGKVVRIALLVVVGLVVLCGLAGSCLFAITLIAPAFINGTPTPAF